MRISVTGLCAAVSLTLLPGCCVSYHRVTRFRFAETPAVTTVIESALKRESQNGINVRYDHGVYIVSTRPWFGTKVVIVSVDEHERVVYLGWDWRSRALSGQVQSAIAHEYGMAYHGTLEFRDLPCSWF